MKNNWIVLFLLIIFIIGLYVHTFNLYETMNESMDCPNLLINKGSNLLLLDTKKQLEDGKNPIVFRNLDEYTIYLENQRKKGIHCPILYLQQENDSQGKDVLRVRSNPQDVHPALPTSLHIPKKQLDASRENPPYNQGNYASFDPYGLQIGVYTDLDFIHDSTETTNIVSDNPMDTNWGGVFFTEQVVKSGKYDEYNITKPQYVTPKGTQYPYLYSNIPPPNDKSY